MVTRKRKLLVLAALAAALVTLLVGCGSSSGPALQFDAVAYEVAAESQTPDAVGDAGLVSLDADSKPETTDEMNATAASVGAKEAAPVYVSTSALDDLVDHDRIVEFARTATLSPAQSFDPAVMKWRYVPSLVRSSVDATAEVPDESYAEVAAVTSPVAESAVVSDGDTSAQPASGTPAEALQDASFTLVTVDTGDGERVILVPSAGYEKICPHRLRMANEFGDLEVTDF